jgi:hypothetical protein
MHKIVEPLAALQQVVYAGKTTEYTEAEDPHSNHRNDAGPAANEETEDSE